ncbi:hypothetical protein HPP92_001245 [Vanilla planifolia]|uniref:Uncharacterized protein n=1 Tax=Vanilla planifolia TaxID=51239 RepID=A0A835RQX8_VANPL|nr:hypothetical protein HPP92_001362 [Vanilla planifolia]KAG0501173.1 hypothetical protein HPP92_001245 [Vanilla planifolia]
MLAIFRFQEMVNHAFNRSTEVLESIDIALPVNDEINSRRYAPYILRNDTSLPLVYYVSRGSTNARVKQGLVNGDGKFVEPGFSVPIYIEETVGELLFRHRKACSSELLIEKKLSATLHNMISIHFDGTSGPSKSMSMDLVGLGFFEVNFSNNKYISKIEKKANDRSKGVVVPVVFEVSMLHYCKMIRLYSTLGVP